MSITATKLVDQAKSWLGYNEKNGSHKKIIDIYNSHKPLARGYKVKYTDEWCATFVSACAIAAGATDIIPTECGCEQFIRLLQSMGVWEENESVIPKPGWIIMYDWQDNGVGDNKGWADHIGIVEKVSGGVITIIEGNMSEMVGRRNLPANAQYIRGYGKPKYAAETTPAAKPIDKVSILDLVADVMEGKFGTGAARKEALGNRYNEVQAFINHIFSAPVNTLAQEVINGKYGTGKIRKVVLGSRYAEVQKRVNELL